MGTLGRRSFLIGAASLLAAPAIARATNLMPVRSLVPINIEWSLVAFISAMTAMISLASATLYFWVKGIQIRRRTLNLLKATPSSSMN